MKTTGTLRYGLFLPCAQPMEPAMKRLYIQLLLVVGVVVVGLNMWHSSPAPLACSTEPHF